MQNKQAASFMDATGVIQYNMTNDYMFRYILQKNTKVLKGLICSLLHLQPKQIKSIEIKPARLTMGYIQFGIGGGSESRGTLKDAHSDENTVTFSTTKDNIIAQNIKSYIETHIVRQNKVLNTINSPTSNADEIKKYKELFDEGIITLEEFEAKKKQLLGL